MKHFWRKDFSEHLPVYICDRCGCRAAATPGKEADLNIKGRLYYDINTMATSTVRDCREYVTWVAHAS